MSLQPLPQLPDSSCGGAAGTVPVFNCIVLLTPSDDGGKMRGRVANLPDISAEGNSERDVLIAITRRFKAAVLEFARSQTPVPWIQPPESPAAGELQRFIPVHL